MGLVSQILPQWPFTKDYLEIHHKDMTQKGASAYDNIDVVGVFVIIVGSARLLQALSWGRRLRLTFFAEGALPGEALNSMTRRGEKLRTPELEMQTQPKPHRVQNCLWGGSLPCISLWLYWNSLGNVL